MKITIFGLTISSSWGNGHATPYRAIVRALARRGHQVTFFEKDVEYYYWRRDFAQLDYCKLVLYSSWEDLRRKALAETSESCAVIVGSYCPDGARIADEVLALDGPLHIFYDLDTPITLANMQHGDLDYLRRDQVGAFDLYLSFTGGDILRELEGRWGARMARALYGCVDPEVHARVAMLEKYRCDLSYMGTYATDRQHKVEELFVRPARLMQTASFVLAGSLYPRGWVWPSNVKRFDHVAPGAHPALYSSSRATLNVTRDGMARGGYCPSGRFFEAAACGTTIITDWFEGLDTFFHPEEELIVVSHAEQVKAALEMTDAELHRVALRAKERTLTEHTGDARAEELSRYMEEARRGESVASAEASSRTSSLEVAS
ncbi:MAG TPA: glycosyltransferase [Terriglobales bacterium]|nr:glycosyltransferase [Terriglobales bacterium]